jgi:hypothetical protein
VDKVSLVLALSLRKPPTASKPFEFLHLLFYLFCLAKLVKKYAPAYFFTQTVASLFRKDKTNAQLLQMLEYGIMTFTFFIFLFIASSKLNLKKIV